MATWCRAKTLQCQDGVVPSGVVTARRLAITYPMRKTTSYQKYSRVNLMSCQHDACQHDFVSEPNSCQHSAVSIRHRVKAMSCQCDAVSKRCLANKTPCPDGVVPRRHPVKTTPWQQHDVVSRRSRVRNGVVRTRCRVETMSSQEDVVSSRVKTMSCEGGTASRRHRVKTASCQDNIVSNRSRVNTTSCITTSCQHGVV